MTKAISWRLARPMGMRLYWTNTTGVEQRYLVKVETLPGDSCAQYEMSYSFSALRTCLPREGSSFCGGQPNSTGQSAQLDGWGSSLIVDNELHLVAKQLPLGQPIYFLASQGQGFVANPGGSAGDLCLGGGRAIARMHSTFGFANGGYHRVVVPLMAIPDPSAGLVAVQAGETWHFQGWYRDGSASNFTPGLSVVFQ